ncbi:hypothetical protein [Pectobacterium aroidearum]
MSEHPHIRTDGITFLPHRLNRHPVVVRGLARLMSCGSAAACPVAPG